MKRFGAVLNRLTIHPLKTTSTAQRLLARTRCVRYEGVILLLSCLYLNVSDGTDLPSIPNRLQPYSYDHGDILKSLQRRGSKEESVSFIRRNGPAP